ncbi:MAG: hypothetical protein JXB10_12915 [Pirellulales bacterium]|nr:hypothetical protein [Pirellulales bacterium]
MRYITHRLALLAVLFYTSGGCCAHHLFAQCRDGRVEGTNRFTTIGTVPLLQHGDVHSTCHGNHCQHPGHVCDAGSCVFITPQKESSERTGLPYSPAPAPADGGTLCPAHPTALDRSHDSHSFRSPALRLHLVNQVLLL